VGKGRLSFDRQGFVAIREDRRHPEQLGTPCNLLEFAYRCAVDAVLHDVEASGMWQMTARGSGFRVLADPADHVEAVVEAEGVGIRKLTTKVLGIRREKGSIDSTPAVPVGHAHPRRAGPPEPADRSVHLMGQQLTAALIVRSGRHAPVFAVLDAGNAFKVRHQVDAHLVSYDSASLQSIVFQPNQLGDTCQGQARIEPARGPAPERGERGHARIRPIRLWSPQPIRRRYPTRPAPAATTTTARTPNPSRPLPVTGNPPESLPGAAPELSADVFVAPSSPVSEELPSEPEPVESCEASDDACAPVDSSPDASSSPPSASADASSSPPSASADASTSPPSASADASSSP